MNGYFLDRRPVGTCSPLLRLWYFGRAPRAAAHVRGRRWWPCGARRSPSGPRRACVHPRTRPHTHDRERSRSDIVLRRRSTFGAAAARPPSIQRTCRARNTDRASKSTSLVATPIATTCGRKTAAPRRVRDAIGRGEVRGFMWFHARTPRRSLAGVGTLPCESPASVAHCGTTPRCARSARRECRTVAPNSGGITPV